MIGRGIRVGHVLATTVVVAALAWTVLRWWLASGRIVPTPSWIGALLLGVLALVVYRAGRTVRRTLTGQAAIPVEPLRAARILVLAQAAALTGAAVVGWAVGHVLALTPDLDVESQRAKLWVLGAMALAGAAVAASGLLAQRQCRIDDPEPPRPDEPGSAAPRQSSDRRPGPQVDTDGGG